MVVGTDPAVRGDGIDCEGVGDFGVRVVGADLEHDAAIRGIQDPIGHVQGELARIRQCRGVRGASGYGRALNLDQVIGHVAPSVRPYIRR